jgi:hypothetical protein
MIEDEKRYDLLVNMNNFRSDNHQEIDYMLDNEHLHDNFEE